MTSKQVRIGNYPASSDRRGIIFTSAVPAGAKVLTLIEYGNPCLVAMVETEAPPTERRFVQLNPTSRSSNTVALAPNETLEFIATVNIGNDTSLLFEVVKQPRKLTGPLRDELVKAFSTGRLHRRTELEIEVLCNCSVDLDFGNLTMGCKTYQEGVGQLLDYCLDKGCLEELLKVAAKKYNSPFIGLDRRLRDEGFYSKD